MKKKTPHCTTSSHRWFGPVRREYKAGAKIKEESESIIERYIGSIFIVLIVVFVLPMTYTIVKLSLDSQERKNQIKQRAIAFSKNIVCNEYGMAYYQNETFTGTIYTPVYINKTNVLKCADAPR